MPLISILVPTYEPNPEHLKAALDYVLAQTFTGWEVFIHDDCSVTDVRAIVEPYLSDPRFHFARSAKNLGIGGNWNACLRLGSGEFVQYLFQDDLWEPGYLATAILALQHHPAAGFCAAHHRYVVEGEEPFRSQKKQVYETYARSCMPLQQPGMHAGLETLARWLDQGLHPNVIGEPSFVMLHRSLIRECGNFDASMVQGLDMEYWVRCLEKTSWVWLPDMLGSFRVHASGASARNFVAGHGLLDRLRIIETLTHTLPTTALREKARETLRGQLRAMIIKYRARKQANPAVQGVSKSALLRFFLQHPLLLLQTVWDAVKIQKAR